MLVSLDAENQVAGPWDSNKGAFVMTCDSHSDPVPSPDQDGGRKQAERELGDLTRHHRTGVFSPESSIGDGE